MSQREIKKHNKQADKWQGSLPKGWTEESVKKFFNTLTKRAPKHKVTECIKRMEGKFDDPGAFCASLADRVIPGWREEVAKKRNKKAGSQVANTNKSAMRGNPGLEFIGNYLDRKSYVKIYREIDKDGRKDEADLFQKVYFELVKRLEPDARTEIALKHLSALHNLEGGGRRNKIFKIADMLGIKVPNMMFASMNTSKGMENAQGKLRVQYYGGNYIRVFDLTNAGKRGKTVKYFTVYDLDRAESQKHVKDLVDNLLKQRSYAQARSWAGAWVEYYEDEFYSNLPAIADRTEKGVDVAPLGFKPLKIETPYVTIRADYTDWVIRDKQDQNNLPACMAQGKRSVKQFYRWLLDNQRNVKNMTFNDLLRALESQNINHHQWCTRD
jgi:hypothetical protein